MKCKYTTPEVTSSEAFSFYLCSPKNGKALAAPYARKQKKYPYTAADTGTHFTKSYIYQIICLIVKGKGCNFAKKLHLTSEQKYTKKGLLGVDFVFKKISS